MFILFFVSASTHNFLKLWQEIIFLICALQTVASFFIISFLFMNKKLGLLQVVVRDIVSKSVVTQFRAHKSPISALCFDPSGTLLVTASVQGHNINIFKIMPGSSKAGKSYMHLYQLQRGLTNAVRAMNFPLQ